MRIWAPTLVIAVVILLATGHSAVRARVEIADAKDELTTVSEQANELVQLRWHSKETSLPPKPATGLAARVGAALSRCGLPSSALQSLSPESQTASGSTGIRQRATLNLAGLTLPQLGAFLGTWRDGDYVVTAIDLSPAERNVTGGGASPGADLPLRAVIVLEGLFRNAPTMDSPSTPPPSSPGSKS